MGMTAFTPTSKWLEGSELAPYFLVVGRAAIWLAPSELRAKFYEGLDMVRRAAHAGASCSWLPRPRSKKAAEDLTTDALIARERESP